MDSSLVPFGGLEVGGWGLKRVSDLVKSKKFDDLLEVSLN